jgi:crossover junction endodeoxyribonuclease RuvC
MSLNSDVFVGLDFSLTSPGMSAIKRHSNGNIEILDMNVVKTKSDEPWFTRRERIETEILRFVFKHKPEKIFVESYSYGSTNGRELAGEVHGICIFALIKGGYPQENIYRVIAPQQLKKFITGKGNATKKQIVEAVNSYFGLSLKNSENDMADAIVLAFIGYCIKYHAQIEHKLNEPQREVLQKIFQTLELGEETI